MNKTNDYQRTYSLLNASAAYGYDADPPIRLRLDETTFNFAGERVVEVRGVEPLAF